MRCFILRLVYLLICGLVICLEIGKQFFRIDGILFGDVCLFQIIPVEDIL